MINIGLLVMNLTTIKRYSDCFYNDPSKSVDLIDEDNDIACVQLTGDIESETECLYGRSLSW